MRRLLVVAAISLAPVLAQVPYQHLVVAYRTPTSTTPGIGILDPNTGVATPVLPQSGALTQSGSRTVAIDPAAPAVLYASTLLSTSVAATVTVMQLDGNLFTRSNLAVAGVAGLPFKLRWASGFGLLVLGRGGLANRMYLRNMSTNTVTPQPTQGLLPVSASGMVFLNGRAYASSEGDGTATAVGTIVEWDLAANTDRVVGAAYAPVTALASFGAQLLAGDSAGNLVLVDPVSGAASPFLTTGLGRIAAIAVDASLRVFVVADNGGTWSVHDAFNPATPLYSSTQPIEDLEVSPGIAPTMLVYGSGCAGSNARTPTSRHVTMPALGATFAVQLDGALPNGAAFFAFGSSRAMDALGPLPRDLGPLGMPGCTQYQDVLTSVFVPTSNAGSATINVAVPANPALAGAQLPTQWVCFDAAANPFGVVTSNGVEAHVR